MAASRKRNLLLNGALILGSLLFTLVLLEVAFRILDIRGYHRERYRDWAHALLDEPDRIPGIHLQFKPDTEFAFRYDSNPRGYFDEDSSLVFRTNGLGLRGPDFELQKAPGTLRVLLLGDSFTFGEGVRWEDTFGQRLQALLDEREGAGRVEVLNLGVSGWDTKEEMIYLEQVGLRLEPDLVLVVYVANDADYAGGLDLWDNFRKIYERPFLRHSYFISYVNARVARWREGRRYVEWLVGRALEREQNWVASFEALSRGRQLAESVGARFAVVLFPFMFELTADHPLLPVHRKVLEHCENEGIPATDLLEAFKGEDYTSLWVHPADQHPNERGHAIAAEAIARFLDHHRLLQ